MWYPETGLDRYSLAFAIKGQPMQPAYHVDRTEEDARQEAIAQGLDLTVDEYDDVEVTRAVPTTWHPLIPSARSAQAPSSNLGRLRGLRNEIVPKTGWWHSLARPNGQALHYFEAGQRFPDWQFTQTGEVIWDFDPDTQAPPPKK